MWISTVTYNMIGLQGLDLDVANGIRLAISDKRDILKTIDQAGTALPGFEAPGIIDPNVATYVVKRAWNTESAAREFVDFVNTLSEFVTATVEEQI